jgi:spore coat protein CotH
MKVSKIIWIFVLAILFNQLSFGQVNLSSSNLPIVIINTQGQEIPNEPKIPATMRIVDNGPGVRNEITGPFNDYDGNIGIEIRGSSSRMFEKKSYGLEIWDDNLNDSTASILGMPVEEDWVLHGPYSDKSLMRNFLAFKLGRDLGRYASRTRFIELVLNNNYRGVYVFMEKIKRDQNRVDIAQLNEDENSGDDLTGGYIVKIDKFDGSNTGGGWASPYRPPGYQNYDQVIYFQFDYPKAKNITPQQKQYIQNYVTSFEDALQNRPSNDLVTGYKSFVDLNSFIDFAIINEVTRNVDGYRLSTFLHKDRDSKDGKLYIGPIWDFNLGFGNADYYNGSDIEGWAWGMNFNPNANNDFWLVPFWWQRFQTDPEYVNLLQDRWQELRNGSYKTEIILAFIDSTAAVLEEAQIRNFQRFNILNNYVWPNNFVGGTYSSEITYLKDWISARLDWLDHAFGAIVTELPKDPFLTSHIKVSPNPFDTVVTFEFSEPRSEFEIEIYSVLGEKLVKLRSDNISNLNRIQWDVTDISGNMLIPGMYILIVKENGSVVANKKLIKN